MWDKKILAADRLVDPLCQQSTGEHMHPCCGPIYNRLLVMVSVAAVRLAANRLAEPAAFAGSGL